MSMSKQEIFDKVYVHLLTQGKKAIDHDGIICQYRGPDNTKCAVGCLIPDELYDKNMEGCSVWRVFFDYQDINNLLGSDNVNFLCELQGVHDKITPEDWKYNLEILASKHDLQIPSMP